MQGDHRAITDQVDYWLSLSEAFAKAFRVEKDLGPSWFVINLLLYEPTDTIELRTLSASIKDFGLTRSNPAFDVAYYLRHLREAELVELMIDKKPAELGPQKRTLPAGTSIILKPEIHSSATKYVQKLVEGLFTRELGDAAAAAPRGFIRHIFNFITKQYLPIWEELLDEIARRSIHAPHQSEKPVAQRLKKSTEVFLLIHILWSARLAGEDARGFDLDGLYHAHASVRRPERAALNKCIQLLHLHGILDADGEGVEAKYRLSPTYDEALQAYMVKFLPMRAKFREFLEPEVLAVGGPVKD